MGMVWDPTEHQFRPKAPALSVVQSLPAGTYALQPDDCVLAMMAGASTTLTLPAATGSGRQVYVYTGDTAMSGVILNVTPNGTDKIAGVNATIKLKRPSTLYTLIDILTGVWAITPWMGNNAIPGVAAGAGAGTGPTVTMVAGSTDTSGTVSVLTGTTPTAAALFVMTFTMSYQNAGAGPVAVVSCNVGVGAQSLVVSTSGVALTVTAAVALAATTTYLISYICFNQFQ